MRAKKWCLSLAIIVAFALVVVGIATYILDPFWHYSVGNGVLTYYKYNELYANPGLARNMEYDSVLVGTSMVENSNVDLYDELLGTKMLRLTYSGGTSYNMTNILDICFDSGNDIKTVYWELDEFQITGSSTEPRYTLPEYMYNEDYRDDLNYLLNMDVLFHYTLQDIVGTLMGKQSSLEARGDILGGTFGKKYVLAAYDRPSISETSVAYKGSYIERQTQSNLSNITEMILKHKNTKFVFFMPPFSVLYWDREIRQGTFDASMESVKYVIGELLKYDNVEVYFFQGEEDIISDLDNYKDYSHYSPSVNDKLTEYLSTGVGKVNKETYEEKICKMKEYIYSYDFEQCLSDECNSN